MVEHLLKTMTWKVLCPCVGLIVIGFSALTLGAQGNAEKGETIFHEHCVECHGKKGDGQGAVGPYLEEQKPANLLDEKTRVRSDEDLLDIIQYGIHIEMPAWEGILNDQGIRDVIAYLRVLAPPPPSPHE